MKKVLVIIPGFGESTKEKAYRQIIQFGHKHGYEILNINPVWNYRNVSDWVIYAEAKLRTVNSSEVIAIGFSLGAYVLLLLSGKISFKKALFCSMSPFFGDQIPKMPDEAKVFFGKRRVEDFKKHLRPQILRSKKNIFLFGDGDWDYAIAEATQYAHKHGAELKIIKNTGHELTEGYVEQITSQII